MPSIGSLYIPKYSNHQFVSNIDEADVIIFGYAVKQNYNFKKHNIGNKPIVVIDYNELGPFTLNDNFIGFNTHSWFKQFEGWNNLNYWLQDIQSNIKIYFKREFEKGSYHPPIPTYPIEYMSFNERFWNQNTQSFEEFNKRIFKLALIFSLSHTSRPLLFAKLVEKLYCCNMCFDERILEYNEYYDSSFNNNEGILLLYKPCFFRLHHNKMMDLYQKSKISISLHGAGKKCNRETEVSFESVPAIQETNQYYTYPWIDGKNCIILPNQKNDPFRLDLEDAINKMLSYLQQPEELYQIYLNSQKNSLNYRIDNYLTRHIIPKLENII